MHKVSAETLKLICEQFPTLNWQEAELNDLIYPSYGVITTFQQFFEEIEKLEHIDLEDISPYADPGALGRENGIF